jgi:hypothetical protein
MNGASADPCANTSSAPIRIIMMMSGDGLHWKACIALDSAEPLLGCGGNDLVVPQQRRSAVVLERGDAQNELIGHGSGGVASR